MPQCGECVLALSHISFLHFHPTYRSAFSANSFFLFAFFYHLSFAFRSFFLRFCVCLLLCFLRFSLAVVCIFLFFPPSCDSLAFFSSRERLLSSSSSSSNLFDLCLFVLVHAHLVISFSPLFLLLLLLCHFEPFLPPLVDLLSVVVIVSFAFRRLCCRLRRFSVSMSHRLVVAVAVAIAMVVHFDYHRCLAVVPLFVRLHLRRCPASSGPAAFVLALFGCIFSAASATF